MIDIIPGQLFKEEDIVLIQSGPYGKEKGKPKGYAVSISLRGRDKPVIGLYDAESEMQGAVSRIRKAWEESGTGRKPDNSMAEAVRILQERFEETDRRLEEWRALQQEEAVSGKKTSGRKKPAKKKEGRQLSVEEAKDRVDTSDMAEDAREALKTWVQYKYEMNQPYKETGFKSLLTKMKNSVRQFGQAAVSDLIEDCMANRYQGIIWDRLKKGTKKENQFTGGVVNNAYDYDALEKELANSPIAT